jgi:rod shape-determining protein MreD
MRLFLIISFSFLIALLLEILPLSGWIIWIKPAWLALVLIFWVLVLPYHVGLFTAVVLGLFLDLLMGTLLGEHAAVLVVITYFISRFHMRIRLLSLWQQSIIVFILLLLSQIFFSWVGGLLGGFRADSRFWLPALTSALIWPWVYAFLNKYLKYYRIYHS